MPSCWSVPRARRLDVHGTLAGLLVWGGLLCGADLAPVSAAPYKIVAVASMASGEELVNDLDALGGLVQNPSLGKALMRVVADRSGVHALPGLDRTRHCGAAIVTDGLHVAPIAWVPVVDVEPLLAALEGVVGPAVEQPELAPRVWKIGRGAVTGYVCQQAGWAYVAQTPDLLQGVLSPELIEQEREQLPAGHDLAVRFYPLRLPEALRTYGIDLLREQNRLSLAAPTAENEQAAARQRLHERMWQLCELSLTDHEQVTWSWRFDRRAKQASLDLDVVPKPNGVLARTLAACKKLPSPALTPAEPSLLGLHVGIGLDRALADQAMELLRDLALARVDQRVRSGPEVLTELARAALEHGELAGHLVVSGGALPLTALVAVRSSELPVMEFLERIEADAGADAGSTPIERNARQIAGRPVHRIHLPATNETSLVEQCFGNPPMCQLTATPQMWLLAYGPQGHAAMERSLERPRARSGIAFDQAMPHLTLSIQAGNAVTLLSSALADQRQKLLLSLIGANLRAADDRLVLQLEPAPEAFKASFVLHEGILRAAAMGLNIVALESLSRPAAPAPQRPSTLPPK